MLRTQELFEKLFDLSPDAVIVSDPEGRIAEASVQAARMFGYARADLLGMAVEILVPKRFRHSHPTHRRNYSANPRVRPMGDGLELYGCRKDGTEFPVEIMLSPVETSGGTVVLSVIRDITERKRNSEAVRRSELQFRALFEHSPDAIVVTSPEGTIIEVNAQVEKLFSYARNELVGQPVEILIPERFRHTHPQYRTDYGAHRKTRPMGAGLELYGRRKDGSEFPVDILLSPVETEEGKITLSVIRDLSEKVRVQEELERRRREKRYLEEELNTEHRFEHIVGESTILRSALKQVEIVSATDVTVLVLGETGTGKRSHRAGDSSLEFPTRTHSCEIELCGYPDRFARERIVWAREGRIYRSDFAESRPSGIGASGNAVPR